MAEKQEDKQKKRQTEKVKKKPEELQGFQYICKLFSIILHNTEKKNAYRQHERSGEPFNNGFKEVAVSDWTFMTKNVLDGSDEARTKLLGFYYENAVDKKKDYWNEFDKYYSDVMSQYRHEGKTLANAFNSILVSQNGTVPSNLFGFAVTLTLAATEHYKDDNFYIGQEEIKELLFHTMKILGYRNVECIPDACFEDMDGLKQLMLAALYHSMMVVLGVKQNLKEKSCHDGRMVVENILKNSWESDLFLAVKQAAEAEKVMELLLEAQEKRCSTDTVFQEKKLPLDAFFTFPELLSEKQFPFLAYDIGYHIHTLVEGKSGSGKTCLAKAIVQVCGKTCADETFSSEFMVKSGLNGKKLLPILLNCEELTTDELQQSSLLECALDRMHMYAQKFMYGDSYARNTLAHYYENKNYVMTYMEREAARGNLLFLLDDFQKMTADWSLFLENLKQLCRKYPFLHVVVFSNPLKPSDKRKFCGYDMFRIGEFVGLEQVKEKVTAVAESESVQLRECSSEERLFGCFADTPGRLFHYLERMEYTIPELICEGIEEEIEYKHGTDISSHLCKKFLMQLSVEALYRRNNAEEKLVIPGNIVTSHFLHGFEKDWRKEEGREADWREEDRREAERIWEIIQQKRILIEQSTFVNSYEFNNPLYFDSLLTDYLAEVLEQANQSTCAGYLMTVLAKLSAAEFARVMPDLFYRISNVSSYYPATQISEENVSMLAKVVSGVAFSYAKSEELEECLTGLQELMKNDAFKDGFTRSGRYENRKSILSMLERLQISIINFGK